MKFSAARCVCVPKPAEPKEICPGRALASAMNSLTVFGGKLDVTTSSCGPIAPPDTATKSFAGSKGILR